MAPTDCTSELDARYLAVRDELISLRRTLATHGNAKPTQTDEILDRVLVLLGENRSAEARTREYSREMYEVLERARDLGPLRDYVRRFANLLTIASDTNTGPRNGAAYEAGVVPQCEGLHDQVASLGPGARVLLRMVKDIAFEMMRVKPRRTAEYAALVPTVMPSLAEHPQWEWHIVDATSAHPEGRETMLLQLRERAPGLGLVGYGPDLVLEVIAAPRDLVAICVQVNAMVIDEINLACAREGKGKHS